MILDCCHAGTGTKDPDPDLASRFLPTRWTRKPPSEGKRPWRELQADTKDLETQMTSFFACQQEQEAYERRFLDQQCRRHAGQFSHFLLESLQDTRADLNHAGTVSNRELLQ